MKQGFHRMTKAPAPNRTSMSPVANVLAGKYFLQCLRAISSIKVSAYHLLFKLLVKECTSNTECQLAVKILSEK